MLNNETAKAGVGLEGPSFTEALGKCFSAALIVVDSENRVSALNADGERMLTFPASEVPHRSVDALPAALREVVQQTFDQRQPQIREITLTPDDEVRREIHVHTSVLPAEKGSGLRVLAVLHDLAPARAVEQHMRHLDCLASIGTLSASMAHEIKNALVAVKTFLELLIYQNKDAELAGIVSREMHRVDSIVSQMLRFAGPAKPTFSALRLHDVLDHSLHLVEHQLSARKIQVKKSLAASLDLVWGDTYQLEQAFLNLFLNASEAMGPNGQLSITTEVALPPDASPSGASRSQIRLRIADTGVGIPPENIPRLFDPFFTTKKKGNGLGLSITRRIIHEHSGSITVESTLNQGTAFTILLPCST